MTRSKGLKAKKQSKCMKIIYSPIRILSKARDLYMKGIEDCAGRVSHGGGVVCPYPAASGRLPKSFSTNVNSYNSLVDDEEFKRQLLRLASKQGLGVGVGGNMAMQMQGMRSYSVGVGKIGRIDEDKPCSFDEEDSMSDLLCPRSRSHAVLRRTLVVYR